MTSIEWIPFQGGFVGLLPCGVNLMVTRISEGPYMGAYQVRFGTCDIRKVFWEADEAKKRGVILARSVLESCLHILEQS